MKGPDGLGKNLKVKMTISNTSLYYKITLLVKLMNSTIIDG